MPTVIEGVDAGATVLRNIIRLPLDALETSRGATGDVVPIPTFPNLSKNNLDTPAVFKDIAPLPDVAFIVWSAPFEPLLELDVNSKGLPLFALSPPALKYRPSPPKFISTLPLISSLDTGAVVPIPTLLLK